MGNETTVGTAATEARSNRAPATSRRWLVALAVVLAPHPALAHSAEDGPVDHADEAAPATHRTVVTAPPAAPATAGGRRAAGTTLAMTPARTSADYLRLVPGLVLVQHGSEGKGYQIYVRGFDAIHGADFEVQVEGVTLNELSNVHASGYLDLGLVIPEAVHALDVTKGPLALDQGLFATGGTARLRLGVGHGDRGLRFGYEAGTTGRHRVVVSAAAEDAEDFLVVEALRDDGFGEGRASERLGVNARVAPVDDEDVGRIDLTALASTGRFELPGIVALRDVASGLVARDGAYDHATRGESARAMAALRWARDRGRSRTVARLFGEVRRLELLENFTGHLLDPERGDRRSQRHVALRGGFDAEARVGVADGLAVELVLGAWHGAMTQWEDAVDEVEERVTRDRWLRGGQTHAHLGAGLLWRPLDGLSLRAGARAELLAFDVARPLSELAGAETLVTLAPRAVLSARPVEGLEVFAAYGRGARPPEARAIAREPARGDGVERFRGGPAAFTVADAGEIGARWQVAPRLALSVAGFATFMARESVFDHVSGVNLELSGTRRLGGELALEAWPLDWLQVRADATLVDARFTGSGEPVPGPPNLMGSLEVTVKHPVGLRGGVRAWGVARRPLAHGATGDGFARVDVSVDYRWRWLRVGLAVENTLGLEITEGAYHFASAWDREAPVSQIPVTHIIAGPPLSARLRLEVLL